MHTYEKYGRLDIDRMPRAVGQRDLIGKPLRNPAIFQVGVIPGMTKIFIDDLCELDLRALAPRCADIRRRGQRPRGRLNEIRDIRAEIGGAETEGRRMDFKSRIIGPTVFRP